MAERGQNSKFPPEQNVGLFCISCLLEHLTRQDATVLSKGSCHFLTLGRWGNGHSYTVSHSVPKLYTIPHDFSEDRWPGLGKPITLQQGFIFRQAGLNKPSTLWYWLSLVRPQSDQGATETEFASSSSGSWPS